MPEARPTHILYMEDDPGLARLVQKQLEWASCIVDLARDGAEGLSMYAAGSYDVVVVDQTMPVHDGLEVIRIMASQGPMPPTVMITGTGDEKIAVEAMKMGARDYIIKDVEGGFLDLLPTVIEQVLRQQRLVEERQQAMEALTDTTQLLETIFDHTHILVAYLDPQFNFIRVNRAYAEADGREPSFFPGKNHFDLYPNAENEEIFRRVVETGQPYFAYAKPFKYAEYPERGVTYWDWSLVPIKYPGGALTGLVFTLANVTERVWAEEEIRRRNEELAALNAITAAVSQSLDLKEILEAALEETLAVLKAEGGLIYLFDEISQTFAPAVHRGLSQDLLREVTGFKMGEGLSGRAAESGKPLVVADLSVDLRNISSAASREGWHSYAGVPIKSKGEVLGVMTLVTRQEGQFRPDHVDLLSHIGSQIGVAIVNARLYQETVRQLEEAETLGAVTAALTKSLNLDRVLQAIVDSATRLISASTSGVIHLADEAAGKLIPHATSPRVNVQKSMEMPIGKGIAGLVMQEKRLINVPNVGQDPRFLPLDTGTLKKSLLTAPLMIEGDCIGTLSLNSDQVGAFSADDERLLTTLAAQATIAVRNARLHQEVQRRVEELVFLNRVGRTVASSLNMEQVLTTVMQEATDVLKVEAAFVLLLDDESEELVFETVVGPCAEKVKGLRLPSGQGIAGWVAREGQRLLVPNAGGDPRFYPGIDEITGFFTKSVLAAPLKVKGRVIGVIEAVNKTEGDFGQADVALLSSVAQSAAISIENAQLFAETQHRFEEMAALHDISLDISAQLEMPELLRSIMERAVGLLDAETGAIYLYDQEGDELRRSVAYGYSEKYVEVTLKPGEGMAGKVFQSGEPMIVNDYRTWEGRAAVFEAAQPFGASLQVPLKWQERTFGVLTIDANVERRTFKQDDVWLATLFANQAAIAIENARLYKDLQNRMEELKQTQAQLIQSAKLAAIGEMAASVAHEINNPLTSIMGFTRLLLQKVDDDDPMKEDLQIIDREAARTRAIVRSLLDFSRQREPRLEPADVNEIVQTTMTLIRHQAKGARVTIKESCEETLPLVSLDADQIKQVFLNIMTNAIQAMPEGGELKVMTAHRPQAQSPDGSTGSPKRLAEGTDSVDCVAVEFHDTGVGISAEDLPRVFDPFFTTKEVGQGTGLGLSISHGIVEKHGGWIEVESKVGWGSIFTVLLPVRGGAD